MANLHSLTIHRLGRMNGTLDGFAGGFAGDLLAEVVALPDGVIHCIQ